MKNELPVFCGFKREFTPMGFAVGFSSRLEILVDASNDSTSGPTFPTGKPKLKIVK